MRKTTYWGGLVLLLLAIVALAFAMVRRGAPGAGGGTSPEADLAGVAGAGGATSLESEAAAAAAISIRVDVSERRLYVMQNGKTTATYGVGVGTKKHPTPRGQFAVRRIIWNPRWVPPNSEWARGRKPKGPGEPGNPMGRVKIFFREPTYYLHGTNDPGSVGSAVSHGCIRMRNSDIIELAQTLMENGGASGPGLVRKLLNRVRQTREVRLSRPVPFVVQS